MLSSNYMAVAIGGAFGAVARYGAVRLGTAMWPVQPFPWFILAVNLLGCLLMGMLASSLAFGWVSPKWQPLLGVGMLGGFTTFSSFALEAVTLWERGDVMAAGLYVALSVGGGVVALVAGMHILRWMA